MNNLIKTLIDVKSDSNSSLIEELIDTINYYKINSIEQLQQVENNLFKINNKDLNKDQRIKFCMDLVKNDYHDLDNLSLKDSIELINIKDRLFKDNLNSDTKIYLLIKLFDLTNKDCYFLKEAYELIINNKY